MNQLKNLPSDKAQYLRCIDADMERNALTPAKVYPVVRWIDKSAVVVVNNNNKEQVCNASRFCVSFEEEYEEQQKIQSCIELEADLREPKEPAFSITDSQIDKLYATLLTGNASNVESKLKEWFPTASCFKEPEKTYKLGDRFKWKEDGEVWQINRCASRSPVITLNNYKGEMLNCQAWVEDVFSITKQELEQIRPDLFEKMEYLG